MNKLIPTLMIAAMGVVGYAPAYAQDAPDAASDDAVATLQIKQGTIMHSTGGEFTNASPGARLIKGERIMVTEGGKAVVVYDNKCRREYDDPGVYEVDHANCVPAAYVANSTVATQVAVAAVLAPLLINTDDPKPSLPPPPPVSR